MNRAQKIAPITSLQPPYSMLHRDVESEILPYAKANNIGVIVYSPMASGLLTGTMTRERVAAFADDDWRKRESIFTEPQLSSNLALADLAEKYRPPPWTHRRRSRHRLDASQSRRHRRNRRRKNSSSSFRSNRRDGFPPDRRRIRRNQSRAIPAPNFPLRVILRAIRPGWPKRDFCVPTHSVGSIAVDRLETRPSLYLRALRHRSDLPLHRLLHHRPQLIPPSRRR